MPQDIVVTHAGIRKTLVPAKFRDKWANTMVFLKNQCNYYYVNYYLGIANNASSAKGLDLEI